MKKIKLILVAIITILIAACNTTKKSVTSAPSLPSSSPPSSTPMMFLKPADGIYTPGNEELAAIQVKYKDITIEKLKEGYSIYSKGACLNCHGAKNIYQIMEAEWKSILDDMAQKAYISNEQKDAVYKYVLAIKATQPK